MTDRKAVIKNADMSEDMQQDAVDCATQAMEKYNIEKDIAAYIKKVTQSQHQFDLFSRFPQSCSSKSLSIRRGKPCANLYLLSTSQFVWNVNAAILADMISVHL